MQFADNEGPDQPAHLRRLIWAFVVHLQDEWILYYMSTIRECPDQSAQGRVLIWTFAVRIWQKSPFPTLRIICKP